MSNNKPAENKEQVTERLAALPEFSQSVYAAIHKSLYAEPYFSDVTVRDIAKGLGVKPVAINAAVGHLIDAGLVLTELFDNGYDKPRTFLHTYEHDEFQLL